MSAFCMRQTGVVNRPGFCGGYLASNCVQSQAIFNDLIAQFILPAWEFVTRGEQAQSRFAEPVFSRVNTAAREDGVSFLDKKNPQRLELVGQATQMDCPPKTLTLGVTRPGTRQVSPLGMCKR